MDYINFGAIAAISLTVVFVLFWLDFKNSACGYGGSDNGKDNWAIRLIRKQVKQIKSVGAWLRRPKYRATEYDDFQDVFSL